VAGGGSAHLAYSTTGTSWTTATSPFSGGNTTSVSWNGSIWLAGHSTGAIAYSTNGISWTAIVASPFTTAVNAIASRIVLPYVGNANLTFNSAGILGVAGGLSLTNGFRPAYSNVTATGTLTLGTSTYGTYYNITTSATVAVSITSQSSVDSNAHWVFRNNTGTYLSIAVSYTTGGSGPTLMTIPPANSVTLLYTGATSGTAAYVFF
jgi:hypothetical protein